MLLLLLGTNQEVVFVSSCSSGATTITHCSVTFSIHTYARTHTHTHAHTHAHTHTHMHTHTTTRTHTRTHTHTHTHTHLHTRTHTHTRTDTRTHTHTCTLKHTFPHELHRISSLPYGVCYEGHASEELHLGWSRGSVCSLP